MSFFFIGMDLASNTVAFRMFQSFERSCSLWEVWLPDWDLSLVLRCLSRPPVEPLKLPLTTSHLKDKLHSLSFRVCHSQGWRSCTFSLLPDFIAKTQNPFVPDPRLDDFVDSDRDELFLCPIRALRKYVFWMEQYHPDVEGLFVSFGMRKKRLSYNTSPF